jgi:hypothetical protein
VLYLLTVLLFAAVLNLMHVLHNSSLAEAAAGVLQCALLSHAAAAAAAFAVGAAQQQLCQGSSRCVAGAAAVRRQASPVC